jgi:hypothetical protein
LEKKERVITKRQLTEALQNCSGVTEAASIVGCKRKRFYDLVTFHNLEIPDAWSGWSPVPKDDPDLYKPAKDAMDIKGTLLKSMGYDLEGELYASSF